MSPRRRIAFLCFNSRFFVRHFLPVVAAARLLDLEIFALLPSAGSEPIELPPDVKVIRIGEGRTLHPVFSLPSRLFSIYLALRRCKPDIAQAFALHPCVVLTVLSALGFRSRNVLTVTGLGLIDIDQRWTARAMRTFVYRLLRFADKSEATSFVFENHSDSFRLGFPKDRPQRKLILMGAGVDELTFQKLPLPPVPPLKLAIVSRMIWSKGIDLAVEAVVRLRRRGVPVELDIYGLPDLKNQRYFPIALLEEWGRKPSGIRWHGFVGDVAAVWRDHHAGLFPSRGGEGLPRALLEAASCGRAIVAADVPGCADFVRSGREGLLVKPDSSEDLERTIETLVREPHLLEPMGNAARERVLQNSTEQIITAQYRQLFTELQSGP